MDGRLFHPCRERIGQLSFSIFSRQVEHSPLFPFCPRQVFSEECTKQLAPLSEPREAGHQSQKSGVSEQHFPYSGWKEASGPLLMAHPIPNLLCYCSPIIAPFPSSFPALRSLASMTRYCNQLLSLPLKPSSRQPSLHPSW